MQSTIISIGDTVRCRLNGLVGTVTGRVRGGSEFNRAWYVDFPQRGTLNVKERDLDFFA